MVLHGFGYTTTPLYLDSVFGIDPSGRGFIIAAFQVGIVLAAIQIGRLRATVGGPRIVGLAFAAMALGSAATAAAPTWWAVALALGLTGFGSVCASRSPRTGRPRWEEASTEVSPC